MTSSATRMTPTRRYFERRAEAFDRLYTRQSAGTRLLRVGPGAAETLRSASWRATKPRACSMSGAGLGEWVRRSWRQALRATWALILTAMLRLARARLAGLESVQLIESDFFDLELPEKFDVVLALGLFDYLDDPGASCGLDAGPLRRDARRHLQPAGPDQGSDPPAPLRGRPPLPDRRLHRGRCRGAARRVGFARVEFVPRAARLLRRLRAHRR